MLNRACGAFHAASFARAPLTLPPRRAVPSSEPSPWQISCDERAPITAAACGDGAMGSACQLVLQATSCFLHWQPCNRRRSRQQTGCSSLPTLGSSSYWRGGRRQGVIVFRLRTVVRGTCARCFCFDNQAETGESSAAVVTDTSVARRFAAILGCRGRS